MADTQSGSTRREALKALGAISAVAAIGESAGAASPDAVNRVSAFHQELSSLVQRTPLVDTHEHLPEEHERLAGPTGRIPADDWSVLFSHYIDSDLISAGMSDDQRRQLTGRDLDPHAKWKLLSPFWPAVKNTGYGRAVRIAMQELYGVEDLDEKAIARLQSGYESTRKPGFYRSILVERANIESCQVNYLGRTFNESRQPTLLMQDMSIVGMHMGPDIRGLSAPAGKTVRDLDDFHEVIRWWFEKYAAYATAVKSQAAYSRGLDYEQVSPERAQGIFKRVLEKEPVSPEERKSLEDHLFWYAVEQATKHQLPVKLHTGYYAGQNGMPLGRVAGNPAQAADLCRRSRQTQFVFMHISYPYWQDLIAVAKNYTNAHIDMCWSWIIDPLSSTSFLKTYLMTAPANKVLTFGGDYIPVECVLGHARIARQGIARALGELVDQRYLSENDALELVDPIMRGNAQRLFRVNAKQRILERAPWL